RTSLEHAGIAEAVVQHFGSERDVLIRVPPQKGESEALLADHVKAALADKYPGVDLRRSEFVGPAVGAGLRESGGLALLAALAGRLGYISVFFTRQIRIRPGLAVVHELLAALAMF